MVQPEVTAQVVCTAATHKHNTHRGVCVTLYSTRSSSRPYSPRQACRSGMDFKGQQLLRVHVVEWAQVGQLEQQLGEDGRLVGVVPGDEAAQCADQSLLKGLHRVHVLDARAVCERQAAVSLMDPHGPVRPENTRFMCTTSTHLTKSSPETQDSVTEFTRNSGFSCIEFTWNSSLSRTKFTGNSGLIWTLFSFWFTNQQSQNTDPETSTRVCKQWNCILTVQKQIKLFKLSSSEDKFKICDEICMSSAGMSVSLFTNV